MEFWGHIGGGLGDIFRQLYHHTEYQILPISSNDVIVDLLVECCNPAVKSVLESMRHSTGRPLFRDIIYRDLFFSQDPHNKAVFDYFKQRPCIKNEEGQAKLWEVSGVAEPCRFGFYNEILYEYWYELEYQETKFCQDIISRPYLVIHPSGGLQTVDGITRDEYKILIEQILDRFDWLRVVAIGASHNRVWVNRDYDCTGCNNTADIHKKCFRKDDSVCIRYIEKPFDIVNPRFIDLTDKTSGALCTNIVQAASAFIGSHSAWINLFWNFRKPNICIISDWTLDWGSAKNYIKTNACKWGFKEDYTKVFWPDGDVDGLYDKVINELERIYDEVPRPDAVYSCNNTKTRV